jgi:hypothetical protein
MDNASGKVTFIQIIYHDCGTGLDSATRIYFEK